MEDVENEERGWGDDWFMDAWDDEDYEVDPEREWERMMWVGDDLMPLDDYLKMR